MIRWSLLGSYVCLITTQWTTVIYCWRYCTTCGYQTTARCRGAWLLALRSTLKWRPCTVLFLKYAAAASIIGRRFRGPDVRDLRWGSLLQCNRQLERAYILEPFTFSLISFIFMQYSAKSLANNKAIIGLRLAPSSRKSRIQHWLLDTGLTLVWW